MLEALEIGRRVRVVRFGLRFEGTFRDYDSTIGRGATLGSVQRFGPVGPTARGQPVAQHFTFGLGGIEELS
eukprot:457654-Alexandrium_andersonii.AAC.1